MSRARTRAAAGAVALALSLVLTACSSSPERRSSATTEPPGGNSEGTVPATPVQVRRGDPLQRPDVYASRNGELHLRVKAKAGPSTVNGQRYEGMYQYETELVDDQGTFTKGTASAYLAPQWDLQPGDHLVIDYVNLLPDMEFQAVGQAQGEKIPQPLNLHTHGLTVAPSGSADNVLLALPPGRSTRVVIDIPTDHHHGLYWYHPHIHGTADDNVYFGLAGHIVVGRADGDYRELDGLPVEPMMLRYNVAGPGPDGELIDASPYNTKGTALEPRGRMVYTNNGVVAPRIKLNPADPATGAPAESAVCAFTNVTGSASYILALDEVDEAQALDVAAVGDPVDLRIVSIDGTPMPAPIVRTGEDAKRGYLLGQGGRVAILVDGPSRPGRVVRLIQVENRSGTGERSAYNWPEQRYGGGYRDYTRDILGATVADARQPGRHVDTPAVLTPNYEVRDPGLVTADVAEQRTFVYNDVMAPAATSHNNFPIDFALFADNPVAQPRVGTVEEWTILNYSSLHHPFHMHTQFGQVMEVVSPVNPTFTDASGDYPTVQEVTDLNQPQPAAYTQDVVNIPPALVGEDGMPVMAPDGTPTQPGKVVLRLRIDDHLGTYVEHCHRLPHEDRGMMSLIRSIPHDPPIALVTGTEGSLRVEVIGSVSGRPIAAIPGGSGEVVAAVGDANGDAIPDVAVSSATDDPRRSRVRVYDGRSALTRSLYDTTIDGRVESLAMADVNADSRDDVLAGATTSGAAHVVVLDSAGQTPGTVIVDAVPFPGTTGAVSVAAGLLEATGRVSFVVGAPPGGTPTVKVFEVDLFGDADGNVPDPHARTEPIEVAAFDALEPGDRRGVVVTVGTPYASRGGFGLVGATPRSGSGPLRLFSIAATDPGGGEGAGHDHGSAEVFSPSGVMRPHAPTPSSPRTATAVKGPIDLVALGFAAGARPAFVSTAFGADLVAVPAGGGPAQRFALSADGAATPVPGALPTAVRIASM